MRLLRVLSWIGVLGVGFLSGYLLKGRFQTAPAKVEERKVLYWVDPMHPAYKSDRPGIAPDCGMKLEPVYAEPQPAPEQPKGRILYWRDPQDPQYRADKPGLNPETGNELEPVYETGGDILPPGTVHVPADKQQLIGVRYGVAELTSGLRRFRALGRVNYDESRLVKVHSKVEGWVEEVFADFTGKGVAKGEPLLTLYSPQILASQRDLLLAARAHQLLKGSPLEVVQEQSGHLLAAARRRLELWDLSPAEIDEVLRTQQPLRTVTLYAPASGVILKREAFPSRYVTPETELYTLADLGRVWIVADVFEPDAAFIRVGQTARVRMAHLPGPSFAARVSYIQPELDPETRTLRVRLEAENPGGRLKPEMFADVDFEVRRPPQLTVPAEAVLDTGERKTVFVARGEGYFEPRAVETGERLGERVVIVNGLKPGERVVTSGTFLLDSESQLRPASPGGAASTGSGPAGVHQHD